MKITLEISDNMLCAVFNGVDYQDGGMTMVSFSLATDDLKDGAVIKLPREKKEGADNG